MSAVDTAQAIDLLIRRNSSSYMYYVMESLPPSSVEKDSPHFKDASIAQLVPARHQMFPLLSDIFEDVVPRDHVGLGFDDWPTVLEHANAGVQMGKGLRAVVSILRYLHEKSPITITPTTKILADGSRYGKFAGFVSEIVLKTKEGPLLTRAQSRGDYLLERRVYWTSTWTFLLQMRLNTNGLRMHCA